MTIAGRTLDRHAHDAKAAIGLVPQEIALYPDLTARENLDFFGLLIGTMANTSEQAMAIGVPLAMGMGMLGGTMWPLDLVGDTMRTVGHATPQAWIMDGWLTLSSSEAPSPTSSPSSPPSPFRLRHPRRRHPPPPPPSHPLTHHHRFTEHKRGHDMTTNDILDRTAKAMAATTVFGPASEHNGVTVIPAAAVRGGGGGGGGTRTGDNNHSNDDSGEGGGFGFTARPAGAIVINGDNVTWEAPPLDLTRIIIAGNIVAVAYFVFAWLSVRAQAKS